MDTGSALRRYTQYEVLSFSHYRWLWLLRILRGVGADGFLVTVPEAVAPPSFFAAETFPCSDQRAA